MKSDYKLFLISKIKGLGVQFWHDFLKNDCPPISSLPEKYQKIIGRALRDKKFLDEVKNTWENINEDYISIYDPLYPPILKTIYDPPLFLFYKGNIKLLSEKNILTIVGSRTLSSYHDYGVRQIIKKLQNSPLVIASGMALGIDSLAHKYALENKLATIAVLGSGLDDKIIYPKQNINLAKDILNNDGLLVSEYSSQTRTQIHHFPKRNRILAGIAKTTLVISGAKKSGTLITAQVALDEGRDVYALPGNINNIFSEGPNKLIQEGAEICLSAEDILKNYKIDCKIYKEKIIFKNKTHAKIYSILQTEAINLRQLSQKLNISPEILNIAISEMELMGLIKTNQQNIIEII